MQGDKIGDGSGKVTSQRVLLSPSGGPRMETSFQSKGTPLGIEQSETGTYSSVVRADGNVFGRGPRRHYGQGEDGAVSYRGAVYYQSASPAWVRLNSVAAIFEYEADAQGNTRAQLWEWK